MKTRDYVVDRIQFGRPLGANQLIRSLSRCRRRSRWGCSPACGSAVYAMKTSTPEMISLVKRNSTGKALDIARLCRDIHGANGVSDEYHVIRHMGTWKSSIRSKVLTTFIR